MSKLPTEPSPQSKNSVFKDVNCEIIAEIPLLPIRTGAKTEPSFDIVDEVIYHLRTNLFMRDFKINSPADRLLIYLTFYAMRCLKMFNQKKTKEAARRELEAWDLKADFVIPGDPKFIISSLVKDPEPSKKGALKDFFKIARAETGKRLFNIVFKDGPNPDKWWVCFANRKFMDKELTN